MILNRAVSILSVLILALIPQLVYASGGAWGRGLGVFILVAGIILFCAFPLTMICQFVALGKARKGKRYALWLIPSVLVIIGSLLTGGITLLNPWSAEHASQSGHWGMFCWSLYVYVLILSILHTFKNSLKITAIYAAFIIMWFLISLFITEGAVNYDYYTYLDNSGDFNVVEYKTIYRELKELKDGRLIVVKEGGRCGDLKKYKEMVILDDGKGGLMTHKLEKNTQHTKPCFINLKVNEIKVDEYRLNYLCGSVKFVDHWSAIDVEAGNLLYGAIQYKRGMDWVNKLIEEGADVNYKSHYGQRSLVHLAAEEARIEELNALIAAGANVNAKNERGDTPIMTCAFSYRKFNITIIGMLLDAGANIDLMYREDLTFRQHVERRLKYNPQNSDYRWLNRKIAQIDRDKVSNND